MLRVVVSKSAGAAESYFRDALVHGDYYVPETARRSPGELEKSTGFWGGKGSKLLGLNGAVERKHFERLCGNQHPETGEQLTPRTKANRRPGFDINFHAPKSVSLAYELGGDDQVLMAFRMAVEETMARLESEMQVRVRVKRSDFDRVTGNMVWATFIHATTRPVNGVPDPHLHAHCFTFNATFDQVENRWKAGQFGDLKRDAPYFEACFQGRLAELLVQQGYRTRSAGKFFELDGLPSETLSKFSRRTAEIEATAKRLGIEEPARKAALGARTRKSKAEGLPMPEVRQAWLERLSPSERRLLSQLRTHEPVVAGPGARHFADLAVRHAFERASVIPVKELRREALRMGAGRVPVDALLAALEAHPELIQREVDGRMLVTTKEVLAEELAAVTFAKNGRGTQKAFTDSLDDSRMTGLSREQRAAVQHVLSSRDVVTLVRGAAGTGKTHLTKATVAALEALGKHVVMLAPSAGASRGVLASEGFEKADTVAAFLKDPTQFVATTTSILQKPIDFGKRGGNSVLWVDEAGLLGMRSMKALFDTAAKLGTRVVLSGDWRQHSSVERGDALRILETQAGLPPAELRQIQRQKGLYREAVSALAEGRVADGFARLSALGAIREVPGENDRLAAIAASYVESRRRKDSVLAISPTYDEGNSVNAAIRDQLRAAKVIARRERTFDTLRRRGLTEAERLDANSYRAGDVVQFHQNVRGFRAGSRVTVVAADDTTVKVRRAFEERLQKGLRTFLWDDTLPIAKAKAFDVFEKTTTELSRGDTIRVSQNGVSLDKKSRIHNGTFHEVRGFTLGGDIQLRGGHVLPKDFAHFTHGYCITSHVAQGKTVDRIIVAESCSSGRAASAEQFYVSASRGRKEVLVFTDDAKQLLESIQTSSQRVAASETQPSRQSPTPHSNWATPTSAPPHHHDMEVDHER